MTEIPHPDSVQPEHDAPPPLPYRPGTAGFRTVARVAVTRPASRIVDLASEKHVPGPMPEYHAPPPTSSKRR